MNVRRAAGAGGATSPEGRAASGDEHAGAPIASPEEPSEGGPEAAASDRDGAAGRPRRTGEWVAAILRQYGLLVAWAVVIIIFSLLRPETFPTLGNAQTILGSQAILVMLTLALLIPLSTGEFDVSVSGVLTMSLVLTGWLNAIHGWPIGLVIPLALLVGLTVGLVNAMFVVKVGVNSFIVTLGTATFLSGTALGINSMTTGGISEVLVDAVRNQLLGIPLAFYYGLLLTCLVWYVFSYTPLGRYLYFVGSGREVARLSGIRVDAIRAGAFVASGLISAFAGVIMAGYLGAADPNIGTSFLLPTFAAAFLGATIISPGRFNPWGSFIAVYFLVTGITGLQLLGLAGWIEQVFYGASLVLAVAFSTLTAQRLTQ